MPLAAHPKLTDRASLAARTPRALVLLLVLAALALGACGGSDDAGKAAATDTALQRSDSGGSTADITIKAKGEPRSGSKLVYGVEAETDSMNPTSGRWAISGLMYANAVFDPIAAYDKDGIPVPYLAESITPSADFKTWSITFRPGITFHNGEKLDSKAGELFIRKLKDSTLTGPAARPIQDVKPTGELSADVILDVAWVAFPHLMTAQGGLIPAPAQLNATGEASSAEPIGTGPFKFKEWVKDNHFTAVRNESYWRKDTKGNALPYLDAVEFRPLPDTQSRIDSLSSGTVNMVHDSHGRTVSKLEEDAKEGKIQFILGGGEDEEAFVMLNRNEKPLDDVRIRKALAHATNHEEYFTVTQEDPTLEADSPFNATGKWYTDPGFPKFDLAAATALVDQWKADNGGATPTITLGTTPSPDNDEVTQLLKRQWEMAGFSVTLNSQDQVTFILGAVTGKYSADLFRQFGSLDPDSEYHFWAPVNSRKAGDNEFRLNFANTDDEQLQAALDKGRTTEDEAGRKAAYDTVAKRMADQVPYIWLQHVRWSIAADNTIRDFLNGELPDGQQALPVQAGVHRLTHAWIEQ